MAAELHTRMDDDGVGSGAARLSVDGVEVLAASASALVRSETARSGEEAYKAPTFSSGPSPRPVLKVLQ